MKGAHSRFGEGILLKWHDLRGFNWFIYRFN